MKWFLIASSCTTLFFASEVVTSFSNPNGIHIRHPTLSSSSITTIPRSRVIRNYFDDISRKSTYIPWTPQSIQQKTRRQVQEYADEKLQVLQKKLYGYDAQAASKLSEQDVELETRKWMKGDSQLMRSEGQEEEWEGEWVQVCKEATVIGCYAALWETILDVTREDGTQLQLIVFPNCPEFYNYDAMAFVQDNIVSSYEFCSNLGESTFVTMFHPRYENEPKLLSPEKHSPFPTFAIHSKNVLDPSDLDEDTPVQPLFQADIKYEGDGELNYSSLRMKENVEELEKLFNSGASSNQYDYSTDLMKDAIALTKDWMAQENEKGENKAIRFYDTIENRWRASNSEVGEEVFADIWNTVYTLNQLIQTDSLDVSSFIFLSHKNNYFRSIINHIYRATLSLVPCSFVPSSAHLMHRDLKDLRLL